MLVLAAGERWWLGVVFYLCLEGALSDRGQTYQGDGTVAFIFLFALHLLRYSSSSASSLNNNKKGNSLFFFIVLSPQHFLSCSDSHESCHSCFSSSPVRGACLCVCGEAWRWPLSRAEWPGRGSHSRARHTHTHTRYCGISFNASIISTREMCEGIGYSNLWTVPVAFLFFSELHKQ